MKSFIHCVWTGNSFPFRVRQFIKNWVPYLRSCNSQFEVIVWLTEDSLQAATKYLSQTTSAQIEKENPQKHFPDVNLDFIRAKINYQSFYIGLLNPLIASYSPILTRVVELLHAHQYYTSISNIARVLLINHCGGIYSDIDYLCPNKDSFFPSNIHELLKLFGVSSSINFFIPATEFYNSVEMENQCLILSPNSKGSLEPLIKKMIKKIERKMKAIEDAAKMNKEFLEHCITQNLAHSMFTEGNAKALLEAYKKRDEYQYGKISSQLYEGLTHETRIPKRFPFVKDDGKVKFLDPECSRHFHYGPISSCTFETVVDFFEEKLTVSASIYCRQHWCKFRQLFSVKNLDEQFSFFDKDCRKVPMYTWANPGYGRLNSLEKAVHTVERHFYPKSLGRIPLSLVNSFICQIRGAVIKVQGEVGKIYAELFLTIQGLIINTSNGFYISALDSTIILHDFLIGVRDCELLEKAVELLNREKFHLLRNVIDPEQRNVTVDDLENFIRT